MSRTDKFSKNDLWILEPKIRNEHTERPLVGSKDYDTRQLNHNTNRDDRRATNPTNHRARPNVENKRPGTTLTGGHAPTNLNWSHSSQAARPHDLDKKAWSIAHLPVKTMGMTLFMLYMSGSNAGIFSILIISYALINAIKILLQVNKNFLEPERIARKTFILQRSLYLLYSILGIFFVLFKLGNMGLIPINRGDYFSDAPPHTFENYAIGLTESLPNSILKRQDEHHGKNLI
ncbi:ER membrane protein complex subunit 4 [Cryptosporidium felis]|nr:ER membrane protein complex subunit 4 [Cryptosporidium felis]